MPLLIALALGIAGYAYYRSTQSHQGFGGTATPPPSAPMLPPGFAAALDPNLPVGEVATMYELILQQTADRRYTTGLLALFAALGLLLAGIGVYGVVSYVVAQRTGEIGLRMALGAQRGDVLWLVVRQGIGTAAAGSAAGLLGAWAFRKAVAQLVFGVSPADPMTFLGAAALLIGLAAAACLVPARRAMKVDPIIALRYE